MFIVIAQGVLAIEGGIDITNPATLSNPELWRGVAQVACAVGPVFGRLPDGKMGLVAAPAGCTHTRFGFKYNA